MITVAAGILLAVFILNSPDLIATVCAAVLIVLDKLQITKG